jgi:hypothetical protein
MFFLLFLLDDRRIRIWIWIRIQIRIRISDYWIRMRIQEAQKQMDSPDPDLDPQHCTYLGASYLRRHPFHFFPRRCPMVWSRGAEIYLAPGVEPELKFELRLRPLSSYHIIEEIYYKKRMVL